MKFIVLPLEDAKLVFTEQELETHRKSIDGTEVIVHEETLLEKRQALGMSTLHTDEVEEIQWTYPNYEYESKELNDLLESDKWNSKEDII